MELYFKPLDLVVFVFTFSHNVCKIWCIKSKMLSNLILIISEFSLIVPQVEVQGTFQQKGETHCSRRPR